MMLIIIVSKKNNNLSNSSDKKTLLYFFKPFLASPSIFILFTLSNILLQIFVPFFAGFKVEFQKFKMVQPPIILTAYLIGLKCLITVSWVAGKVVLSFVSGFLEAHEISYKVLEFAVLRQRILAGIDLLISKLTCKLSSISMPFSTRYKLAIK